jgi:hypothetical protein
MYCLEVMDEKYLLKVALKNKYHRLKFSILEILPKEDLLNELFIKL